MITVKDFAIPHRGDHCRNQPDVVLLPGAEQATANQIVNLALLSGHARLFGRDRSGNDGVVIGHLRIVDESPSERALARAGRQALAKGSLDRFNDARQRGGHILR